MCVCLGMYIICVICLCTYVSMYVCMYVCVCEHACINCILVCCYHDLKGTGVTTPDNTLCCH